MTFSKYKFILYFFQTAVNTYPQSPLLFKDPIEMENNKKELTSTLCFLSKICLHLIHSVHGAQYTAMLILNKIIDLSVKYHLTFCKIRLSEALQHPCQIDLE